MNFTYECQKMNYYPTLFYNNEEIINIPYKHFNCASLIEDIEIWCSCENYNDINKYFLDFFPNEDNTSLHLDVYNSDLQLIKSKSFYLKKSCSCSKKVLCKNCKYLLQEEL